MGSVGQLLCYSSAAMTSCCSIISPIFKVLVKIIPLYSTDMSSVERVWDAEDNNRKCKSAATAVFSFSLKIKLVITVVVGLCYCVQKHS